MRSIRLRLRAVGRGTTPRCRSKDILYGQPPFGWKLSKKRVIAMVRHIYFIRRLPMRQIVEELASLGVVNRRGNAFPLSRVCEILNMGKKAPPEAG